MALDTPATSLAARDPLDLSTSQDAVLAVRSAVKKVRSPNLVVMGGANRDVNLRVRSLPLHGETVASAKPVIYRGGKGANQAVQAALLMNRGSEEPSADDDAAKKKQLAKTDGRVALICKLGADETGSEYRNYLQNIGNWYLGVRFFHKACCARPTEPRLWTHLGDGLARLGRGEEAIRAYEQAWFWLPQIETATRLFRCYHDRDAAWGVAASPEGAHWAFAVTERFLSQEIPRSSSGRGEALLAVFRAPWHDLFSSPSLHSAYSRTNAKPPSEVASRHHDLVLLASVFRGAPEDILDSLLYLACFSRLQRDVRTAQQLITIGQRIGGTHGEEIVQTLRGDGTAFL